jgi:hypothetical protein
MTLYCKPGLARIIHSLAGNRDKIVTCIRLEPLPNDEPVRSQAGPYWLIDRWLPARYGRTKHVSDWMMRPIEDTEGEDEILRIAGYPKKETA